MYAVVYPARASPKKMGPPVAADPALWVVTKAEPLLCGEAFGVDVEGARGRVSNERARRQEARIKENEVASKGSWVEV